MVTARIELARQYDGEVMKKCFELYNIVFPQKYSIPFECFEKIAQKNPRLKSLIWLGDELAGYIHYYPLTTAAYDRFLASEVLFDLGITPEDIMQYEKNHVHDIFIPSIVLNPKHQGKMLGLVLMRGLMLGLKSLEADGYKLGRLGATAYTDAGMHQLKTYMGLKVVRVISETSYEPGFSQPFKDVAVTGDCATAIKIIEEYMGFEGLQKN
jgi:hypothetical protein